MLKITRLEFGENETLGVLMLNGEILCWTLELPWKDNQHNISCIPKGKYKCVRGMLKGNERWLLQNVPNRTGIFIHAGNVHSQIQGCVLTGSGVGYVNNDRAVLGSPNALNELMVKTKGMSEIDLEIV